LKKRTPMEAVKIIPPGAATSIGSVPYTDPVAAVERTLRAFPALPAWPQLPNRSFLENMYVQYSEGLPCLVVDGEKGKMYFDTDRDVMAEMELFYSRLIGEGDGDFGVSPEYAAGFHCFLERLASDAAARERLICAKGQVVGPVSFGLTVTDRNKRAILYHDELMDAAVKSLSRKAAWQVRELKKVSPRVMIWLDEPYLASFGSGYVSLAERQVLALIGEVVQGIHEAGALAGIHCCGNTDWSLLMKTELDIINFDAYDYFTGMSLYPEPLKNFLGRGGMLAMGIVPTSEKIMGESAESLAAKMEERVAVLGEKTGLGRRAIGEHCLITPSCGTGTLPEELADRIFGVIGEVGAGFSTAERGK